MGFTGSGKSICTPSCPQLDCVPVHFFFHLMVLLTGAWQMTASRRMAMPGMPILATLGSKTTERRRTVALDLVVTMNKVPVKVQEASVTTMIAKVVG